MYKIGQYKKSDSMNELICENYKMLLVISRFDIPLGFGNKTIDEVCKENSVDVDVFLAIVNLLVEDEEHVIVLKSNKSIINLINYLKNSHKYFLDFKLPSIRENLKKAIPENVEDVSLVIMKYFDEYVLEVKKHMSYEEKNVFPYVEKLIMGERDNNYNIKIFSKQHDQIESKLSELKNIIIKYYVAKSSNELNSVLFDIFTCAEDLLSHNNIEDNLFVPTIFDLENKKI